MNNRYSRQELCTFIGSEGQVLIRRKHVLIIGAGALGSASAEMLVRSGIGKLTIIDRDYVEWSNLQRQQLYSEDDAQLALPKTIAARNRLSQINSNVQINAVVMDVMENNLQPFLKDVDVLIDATDNFDIRFILNDLAQQAKIPFIFAACAGSFGSTYTIIPGKTPCLQCLLKEMPLTGTTCDNYGIISPIIQMIASHQVTECLKLLVGDLASLRQTYLTMDLWSNQHYSFRMNKAKRADCLSCGDQPSYPFLQYERVTKAAVLCGRSTVQLRPFQEHDHQLEKLEMILKKRGKVLRNPYLLSCQLDEYRIVIFRDGRVFVHGTSEIQTAKNLYYSLLG